MSTPMPMPKPMSMSMFMSMLMFMFMCMHMNMHTSHVRTSQAALLAARAAGGRRWRPAAAGCVPDALLFTQTLTLMLILTQALTLTLTPSQVRAVRTFTSSRR